MIPTTVMRDAARAMATAYMHGTVVIYDRSWTSDGIGGGTAAFTASGTVVGNVAPAPYRWFPNEGLHQSTLQDVPYWLVTLPYSATVTTTCRLACGSTTYEVMEVNNDQTDRVYTACKCAVVT